IAAAGIVVVVAIVLVVAMVLRSNSSNAHPSNGLGFDPQQGQIGDARGPQSQPGRYGPQSQPNAAWGNVQGYAQPTMPGQTNTPWVAGQRQTGMPAQTPSWGGQGSGAQWGDAMQGPPPISRPLQGAEIRQPGWGE